MVVGSHDIHSTSCELFLGVFKWEVEKRLTSAIPASTWVMDGFLALNPEWADTISVIHTYVDE